MSWDLNSGLPSFVLAHSETSYWGLRSALATDTVKNEFSANTEELACFKSDSVLSHLKS
jgi:hypothetical protein